MNSERVEPPKDQARTGQATPGAQLKAQREALGMSVEQIADQLKLAPRQVVALEDGDYASLPNMAVTRGFVRAYAKVVRIDATPLVAMIEVRSPTSPEVSPPRKEIAATFSDTRMPLMKPRSSHTGAWVAGAAAVVVVVGGLFAYQSGLVAHTVALFQHGAESAAVAGDPGKAGGTTVAPLETTLVKPGQETTTLQSPNVPLVSVPPVADGSAAGPATAAGAAPSATGGAAQPAPAAPAAGGAAATATAPVNQPAPTVSGQPATVTTPPAPATAAAAAPAAAASATGTPLVLKVNEDSWIEIRRPGAAPLISRLVKAGSTETFDIKNPSLLIVGKPAGVQATLGGAPLALPQSAGGTIARVNIK
ncbi:XRE family transcriptional regulator [Duganella sp. Leaf126]|uniref:helix-turn-helix domain-containing protein n=1 Tax=Duganella sp. Leaf126 TaxID=1736266 RepID=UPI0006FD0377|nr:helix-turn-helix domain-containing protein [Duganella sp. Leaf126]KQQ31934.1 XRE family transcriptional regulator [Duganella sp. Leaf126]